ncbi:MAG: hypothetical protein R3350_01360 [Saprospiraceae bacterium]|nr:hypothetical protein [Saprospiraceae bacterium]
MKKLHYSFGLALLLAVAALILWEIHWRNKGYEPDFNDNKHLWAYTRAQLDELGEDDWVLLGSSRVLFDVQLDVWEDISGKRPLQLAGAGQPPLVYLRDIVENTDYDGNLLVGVTSGLFYMPDTTMNWDWARSWQDHYYKRTYADKFNFWLSGFIQPHLAFLHVYEDHYNSLSLEKLIGRIDLTNRDSVPPPYIFPFFSTIDKYRNTQMLERLETDTVYANAVARAWGVERFRARLDSNALAGIKMGVPMAQQGISQMIQPFLDRGGKIVFLRCPSSGSLRELEDYAFPRELAWDPLLEATGCAGYHFEDFPEVRDMICPELSHLSRPDAVIFTRVIVDQLKADGHL